MSTTGGMMMTQSKLSVGQRVEISLHLPASKKRPRTVGARVVRVTERREHNRFWKYDAAMKFEQKLLDTEPELKKLSEEQFRAGLY